MPILTLADALQLLDQEQLAEQRALTVLCGTSFADCLRFNGLAPAIEISTPKGKTMTIHGSDIYNHRTWKKFLASIHQEEPIYQLTEVREELAGQYKTWLLQEHTARYHALSTEADLAWLERVIMLAVTRHIMEDKYAFYTTKGLKTFIDLQAPNEMSKLLALNQIARDIPRSVHHVVKEPARAREIIALFYEEHYRQFQIHSPIMNEPDPFLPEETPPPFTLLPEKKEEPDE